MLGLSSEFKSYLKEVLVERQDLFPEHKEDGEYENQEGLEEDLSHISDAEDESLSDNIQDIRFQIDADPVSVANIRFDKRRPMMVEDHKKQQERKKTFFYLFKQIGVGGELFQFHFMINIQ